MLLLLFPSLLALPAWAANPVRLLLYRATAPSRTHASIDGRLDEIYTVQMGLGSPRE
jgi:hypothetical protein